MKQRWQALGEQFNALSQRERGLITIAMIVVIGMGCFLPLESLWQQHQKQAQQLAAITKENTISVEQISLYQQRLAQDPDTDYRHRLTALNEQNKAIDESLNAQMVDMVPADYMPQVLSQLLGQVKGIRLESFTSLAPIPLLEVGDVNKMNLYSHGIRLTLVGDYFAVLKFTQAIEDMPDRLYWKRMDYQVDNYPKAKVELELFTLSINKDFISVAKKG